MKHPVVATLESLRVMLESIQSQDFNATIVEDIERFKQGYLYVAQCVSSLDPNITPTAPLDNIEKNLKHCVSECSAFASSRNQGHLANANSHLDNALVHAFQLPQPLPLEQAESIREAVTSFRRSAGQLLASLERDRDRLAAELQKEVARVEELAREIATQKARVDSVISDQQGQFSASESARRDEFMKLQTELASELRSSIEESGATLSELEDQAKDKISSLVESAKRDFNELMVRSGDQAKSHIKELEKYRDQAQQLMHVIGSTGMAGEFQKEAGSAKNATRFWQGVTVLSMCGLIGFAISAYLTAAQDGQALAAIASRIFVAVAFGILAVFSVRQADRYHEVETRNRRYQLELSSLEPYLAGLPEDVRNEVKVKLAEKFFGNHHGSTQQGSEKVSGNALDLVRMALEATQEALKK